MTELERLILINEEQEIVDELIKVLEREIKDRDARLQTILKNYRKAKEQGPDAYGMLVDNINDRSRVLTGIQRAKQSKDELYTCRLMLECDDGDGKTYEQELKIGLSTYCDRKQNVLVCDWKREVCRHFLLDNCAEEFDGIVKDKRGRQYRTHYELKLKRNVDTRFSHVRDVTHLFPLTVAEAQKIIFDAFLSELASRRNNTEFQNIIFSIQKKQGEIIKLPYDKDLIVQGCAGSGKSMIMLHRLPIMLYDNPDILNSNNVYIISPSETYIQMVEKMREDLEISDLNMGTINQYYDHVLSKYNIDLQDYGRVSYATKVDREIEEYIYGRQLNSDIKAIAKKLLNIKDCDFSEGFIILDVIKKRPSKQIVTIDDKVTDHILKGTDIITANNVVLKGYYNLVKEGIAALSDLSEKAKNRKLYILRNIDMSISKENDTIKQRQRELEDKSLGEVAIKNRTAIIENAWKNIARFKIARKQIENEEAYFSSFTDCSEMIVDVLRRFASINSQYENNTSQTVYFLIQNRKKIYKAYRKFIDSLLEIEEKYLEYIDPIIDYANKYESLFMELLTKNDAYLDEEYYNEVVEATDYYSKLKESIVKDIYLTIMERCGQIPNEKGEIKGLSFSPYLYLKIMYSVKGSNNISKERLVCIDEAQGLAPEELKLIKDINGDKLILNLFGDVKQHIEGTKGIDSWMEFCTSISTTEQLLMENYRNASQITEECNRRFGMNMKAINTPGSGVTNFSSYEEFESNVKQLFINIQKPGIRAIIVNDVNEAKQIRYHYSAYQDKIHDMTNGHYDFHRTRWNLLTVEQAKGLEFGTVVAVSGNMTLNRKYITFTRALDELFIYDLPLVIDTISINEESQLKNIPEQKNEKVVKEKKERKVTAAIDYSQSEVLKYFEGKGLEVNDMRAKGGVLWVIGEQAKIKQYVDEACEKFSITGSYSSGKATGFRPGCYFKTKK